MQRTTVNSGTNRTTELIRAAQYGDPWACDELLGSHRPLVHALVSRALDARPATAVTADAVTQDTLRRAHGSLHTLSAPENFRPWLLALAVDTALAHTAAAGPDAAGGWLDVRDALLAALGSLEDEGRVLRYETAAALQWTPESTAAAVETARARCAAARSVTAALARRPRCPALHELTAGWDGRPGPGPLDHLAPHVVRCAACTAPAPSPVPASGWPTVPAPRSAPRTYGVPGGHGAPGPGGAPEADEPTRAYELGTLAPDRAPSPAASPAPAPGGRGGTRAARRVRRRADERNRRRAAVAAGIAVVAVTGGAFSLYGGRGGQEELLEANRAAAPGPDLPLTHEPDSLTTTPATTPPAPSATAPSARPSRAASAKPTAAGKRTATPRPATATPTPHRTTATPAAEPPKPTAAPTTAAPAPAPTTAGPTAGTGGGTGAGAQHDTGRGTTADQVIALVNAERAKAGCGPVTASATLARAAQGHSDDMAARDFFDHTDPDGDGPGERVTAAGYPWSTYGENIAMGQTTAEQVMEGWMNSPGHRANILNCSFKEIGVGVHTDGGPYWTQVFGAR
ncbi:CAP domain-containing protein [Streptomyces griseus]|uniref:CAP domain-containing protein n=1 Tax=Streptomyces griseus TaxID=1911 RepID=UPI00068CEBE6|nr:CAP domain-containing protein [Streptomyces griseus]